MATQTPPKSMSSRLLTMKFMQRAAASPASSPTTPNSDEQSSKRRKISHSSTPQQDLDSLVNQSAIQAATAEEEKKREEALIRRAAELGDARWVLDIPKEAAGDSARPVQTPLNVVQVGFAQIDSSDAVDLGTDSADASYRKIEPFRRYNMDKKKVSKASGSDSDESSSESDSSDGSSEEEHGAARRSYGQGPRSSSAGSHKRSEERTKAREFAEKRRKKEVKLNNAKPGPKLSSGGGLLSISSGGNSSRPPVAFTCHRCGKPGHKAADCTGSTRQHRR